MNKTATTIALIMFGIFIIIVYLKLDDISKRMSHGTTTRTVTTQSPCDLSAISSFVYAVYAELNHTNSILTEVYSKQHPQLKKELLFWDFQKNVTMRKSSLPAFRFKTLKEVFKDNYDELVERYKKEYPSDTYFGSGSAPAPAPKPAPEKPAAKKKGGGPV
jgi:hypothetical protein